MKIRISIRIKFENTIEFIYFCDFNGVLDYKKI